MTTLILSSADNREIVRRVGLDTLMDRMIQALERALEELTPERAEVPLRSGFHYHNPAPGLVEWMPVMINGSRATIKVVGYHPENPTRFGLPTILGTVSSYDTETGHLIGLADGTFLTALRTGAASAVATAVLARDAASVLGVIGCGAQAIAQLHAVSRVRDVTRVLYFDLDPATQRSFEHRVGVLGLSHVKLESAAPSTVVRDSDILCTATSVDVGAGPVFEDVETKPWLHINAAGSDFEGKFEIPRSLLERSIVIPDVLEQAVTQGECQQLEAHQIGPELADLLRDAEKRTGLGGRLTVFDSTGWAIEDHVALTLFMDFAREFGLGTEIEVESISHDAKNPYDFVFEDASAGFSVDGHDESLKHVPE